MPDINQLFNQQQAALDAAAASSAKLLLAAFATIAVFYAIILWGIWMFYRCFRDQADETRKIRILLEFQNARTTRPGKDESRATSEESRYMPRG
jgi:fatty acid desaturase